MTQPADEPDWSLLPDRPVEFFGLSAGFDQKTLKRQYSSLIRRFKPEKFPLQFQQIRAAYESLNRYFHAGPFGGLPFRVVQVSADEIELTPSQTAGNGSDDLTSPLRPATAVPTLLDRVRRTPPGRLLEELCQSSSLNRDERLLRTFLDDARRDEPSLKFLDGLLAAARASRDEASWDLLRQYLRSAEARSRCAEILERIFFVLASDEAFSLTEPLWDELQQRAPFAEFRRLLDDCVRHVTDHRVAQRLAFEIRLLRRTLFYADPQWTAERLARLTSGDVAWPDWLDHQIWCTEQLVAYTKVRRKFLNGNPLRGLMDEALQAYCQDSPEFERLYLEFQHQVLKHPDEVIAAFPRRDGGVLKVVWNVWHFLSEQVAYRFASQNYDFQESLDALSRSAGAWKSASRPLLRSPRRWGPIAWTIIAGAYLGIPPGCLLLMRMHPQPPRVMSDAVLFLTLGLIAAAVLHLGLATFDTPTELRWRVYGSGLRQALFAFVRRHPLPAPILLARLKSRPTGSMQTDNLLAETQHDVALKFYAAAAWVLR